MKRRGGAVSIAFRDILYLIAFMYLIILVIVLPALNPPAKDSASTEPAGMLAITAMWPEGNVDVDLWVECPGEKKPIGYTTTSGGIVCNLLRDDLGTSNDNAPANLENIYGRSLPDGEYVVNLHLYRGTPVPVFVEVRIGPYSTLFASETVTLTKVGQEVTVVRFALRDGKVVPGSANRVFKALRSAK